MLEPPFMFDPNLSDKDFQKIGQLSIRWSHIEFITGHCLRKLLRLSHEEAALMVFPLQFDQRLQKIKEVAKIHKPPLLPEFHAAFDEVWALKSAIQLVRNNVLHAFVDLGEDGEPKFFNRAKSRTLTRSQIFSAEEITNYVAHAVLSMRYAIGFDLDSGERVPLPDRPDAPEFLREAIPKSHWHGQAARQAH
jgi:hypothetical protein